MRLLEVLSNGDFRLTDNFPDNKIPRYAILSHTWGSEEVTFEDIDKTSGQLKHQGRGKAGYEKIEFCGKQSARDGLQYFWVDSCCIDKSIRAELQHALSSMFIWYERAEKCYVYLSDVTLGNTEGLDKMQTTWQQAFQRSKWFTRGWTLQELLAPISVEFFSKDAYRLGNSRSLEQQIHNITAIPVRALRGEPLSQFSVNERLRWKESRITTIEEDLAYSLLGIFGVDMPLEYGEGRVAASKRLRREIDKQETCVRDLRLIDPGDHKQDIEQKRGGLVENSFRWILEHPDFQKWGNDELNPLLWINGDPGKGKTMLLCAIVNELRNSMDKTDRLLYFFCEATNIRINNATAVLRGLMYMLVRQQPSLVSHIQKKYDYAGKTIFEGPYAWVALSNMFSDMLQDPNLRSAYIIIDALDECTVGLPELLDFIIQKTSTSPHIKWLISSRNWPSIENRLDKAEDKVRLSLELNAESVSTAVNIFIRHKVQQLVQDDKLHDAILDYLVSNADNTFLWVALVCQNLEDTPRRLIRERLKSFPPGLDSLYGRMITQIYESKDSELCKRILASIATVYEPITISELSSLVKMPEESSENVESLHEIVNLCGSFLVVRNHRIYLVHQSAKDYLLANASGELFPSGRDETHHAIFSRSLMVMSRMLRRDMYNLKSLGCSIEEIQLPDPDPLATSRYSCIYWADHLCESDSHHHVDRAVSLQDGGSVDVFMKEKYLYWIEALSLCRSVSKGVLMVAKLQKLVQGSTNAPALLELLHDARRFILYHKQTIETSPLQTYASALIFSPTNSLIRRLFQKEEPDWFEILPPVTDEWSLSLQTLEGHSDKVRSVAFSHDSTLLASASTDRTVKIWDASSGACRATLEGHSGSVTSVAFSHDSTLVASGSEDGTIRIWDASSGMCCAMLEGHSGMVSSVAFSHDSTLLASASHEERTKSASLTEEPPVRIWDVASRTCRTTFEGHGGYITPRPRTMTITQHGLAPRVTTFWDPVDFILPGGEGVTNAYSVPVKRVTYHVMSVAFSHDSKLLASASWEWWDRTIQIWDASSGACHATLEGHSSYVNSVTFSHDSRLLASASDDCKVKIWDASSGTCLATIEGHMKPVMSVAFSHDSTLVVSASKDFMVRTWDASSGTCCATLEGHSDSVTSVAFSQGSKLLASASEDGTIRIWDASSGVSHLTLEDHSDRLWFGLWLHAVRIWDASSDARRMTLELRGDTFLLWLGLCSWSQWSRTVRLWNAGSGGCRVPLEGCSFWLWLWLWLWWDRTVRTWLANSGPVRPTLMGRHSSSVTAVAFSHDSTLLASASDDGTIRIWGTDSGVCHAKLGGHWGSVTSVTFSRDSTLLASAGRDGTVRIWDAVHGERRATIQVHAHGYNKTVCSVSFSNNSKLLASASEDHTVRIWNVTSGACRRILKGCFPNESYAMRIDGSKVKWTPESNPEGHSGAVYSTAFSRDSSLLVSASEDRTVKIWDVSSGTCCATLAGHSDPVISVAFSHDSTLIASASHDRTVRIWDTISGECRQTVNVESLLYNISFDITGWYLHTDVGLLALDVSQASNTALDKAGRQNLQHRGAGLNSNGEWISFKSKPLVRLPSEYRPNRSTVSGSTISIGVGSGMVWVCKLQAPDIEQC